LVVNRVTEFKIITFGPMGKIAKLKDSQFGIQRSGKEIRLMEKK